MLSGGFEEAVAAVAFRDHHPEVGEDHEAIEYQERCE
jgi:hypothetical protein